MTNNIKQYQNNPQLKTLNAPQGWQGTPIDKEGRFLNLNHPFFSSWVDVFRWKFQKSPFSKTKKEEVWNPDIFKDDSWLAGSDSIIVWLGHSTFYIRINGVKILIDPIFDGMFSIKRQTELPVNTSRLTNIDYILISHDHRDHLDKKSLKTLANQNPDTRYLTGLGMKKLIHDFTGSDKIEEAGWYQEYSPSHHLVNFTFIPSRHWSKRSLYDTNKRLWGGFVIEGEDKRILFGGDSGYDSHYSQLGTVFGDFSYAILGIGAYEPAWFMSSNHQSPKEAFNGFKDLNAQYFIPMHYSTFDLSDEPLSQPLKDLRAATAGDALEEKLNILSIGKPLAI